MKPNAQPIAPDGNGFHTTNIEYTPSAAHSAGLFERRLIEACVIEFRITNQMSECSHEPMSVEQRVRCLLALAFFQCGLWWAVFHSGAV